MRSKKEILIFMLLTVLSTSTIIYGLSKIGVNYSNSEPLGVYWLSKSDSYNKDDKVFIDKAKFEFANKNKEITFLDKLDKTFFREKALKTIKGVEGDTIIVKDNIIYLNGEAYGEILNIEGVLKPFFEEGETYVVPKDKYVLLGRSLISYDSRYLGYFEKSEFLGKAKLMIEVKKDLYKTRDEFLHLTYERNKKINEILENILKKTKIKIPEKLKSKFTRARNRIV